MSKEKEKDFQETKKGKTLRLLEDEEVKLGEMIVYEVDPKIRRNVLALIHRALQGIDGFAKYMQRRLIRDGVYTSYHCDIEQLRDGYRIIIEMRLRAIDKRLFHRYWYSAKQYLEGRVGKDRIYRQFQRKMERGELEEFEEGEEDVEKV